ncbi:MAG: hypothetical protein ABSA66_08385 [Roseiarcus sp.]
MKLADATNENRIELALALCELEEAKPGSVADLVRTRPRERRKLYYLLDVGRWLRPTGQPMSRYSKIGWTKLAVLAEHSRNRPGTVSARKGLDYAEQCTAKELPAVLEGAPLPEKGKKTHHSVHLRLTRTQYRVFAAAMGEFEATPAGRGFADKERAITKALAVSLKARSATISGRQS